MAENKFIKHLKGEQTAGSLVEIKNQNTPASFGNMPQGTSDSNVKYSDVRGDVTVVANGTTAWKLNDSTLTLAPIVNGDGTDYISNYAVSGAGLWVNSTYTFPSTGDPNHPVAMIFNPNTKWVLKLCGDNLIVNNGETLELTVVITIGSSNIISKQFTVREQATHFCKELVIDFDESNSALIKAMGLSTMQLQVLCGTADASARIYNGMTTLTVLQRKVDAAVVSGAFANVEEVLRDGILPSDYFNNAAYIAQIEDGDSAYAVFTRDGDTVALSGWAQPIPDQTNNAGKFLTTDGSLMSWAQLTITDVDGLSTELSDLQDQIDDLSGRGRFLALWNCATGLAESNPPESPYPYKAGDYFVVGTVSSADPAVNYKPDGSSYTTGVASTTVETNEVSVNDTYFYDGTVWKLQSNAQKEVSFSALAGSPYDNTALGNALDSKQDTISDLATIRSGAALGATALQPGDNVSDLVNDAGYLVMGDLTNFVTKNTAQTISGLKTFSADITLSGTTSIKNTTNGVSYTMLYRDASGIHVGTSTQALLLAGSNARPKFNNNDIAMLSDVPTAVSQLTNDTGFITNAVNDLQNYTLTSNLATVATTGDYGDLLNKPTIPAAQVNSDWNANSGVAQILNKPTLATVATSGSYNDLSNKPTIPTVNNPTITITQGGVTKGLFTLNQASGDTIALDAGGGGIGNIDNLTITANADDEIQTVATINANPATGATNPIYDWVGTLAEYNAQNIETLHPDWVCFITDDIGGSATAIGQITEALNDKVDKGHQVIDFQEPTAGNNYTWYRKYADGWVEQGGYIANNSTTTTVTLPVPMKYNNYTLVGGLLNGTASTSYEHMNFNTLTRTNFKFTTYDGYGCEWLVCGMAA